MTTASRPISVAEAADLLAKAAEPTLAAVAWDERRAAPKLRPLFAALRERLFDPDLSLERLSNELGIADRAVWSAFGDAVEEPAWTYVREARLETAARLLLQTSLSVEKIGLWVGYESVTTFRKLLREHLGSLPSQYQRRARRLLKRAGPPPRDFDSPEYWERAVAGELGDEEARELDDYLDGLYPEGGPAPTVEDNPWTRLREELAAALADSLDQLPWPSQRRLARDATWFPDGSFFYELSRRGREAEDPARGVELALLAIDTMASNGLLEVDPGAAAMAWARLARARWRAGDLPGTEDALAQSTRDFERTPQQDLEAEEEAERSRVTASFRWFQGRREEALALADYSVAQHRKARSADLGKALWLRAELRASLGETDGALEDLEEARGLLGDVSEEWVELWLRVLVATGNKTEMANALDDARPLAKDDARLKWLQGYCDGAQRERLWTAARDGFAANADDLWTARTALDLVGHCLDAGRRTDALAMAAELTRAFGALAADAESLAALKTLRSAVECGWLTAGVLGELGGVLGRWEWERRGRRGAWGLAK